MTNSHSVPLRNHWAARPGLTRFFIGLTSFTLAVTAAPAAIDHEVVAVAANVSSDYVRAKLPDGSFEPVEYAFGPGGRWDGPASDATLDPLKFTDIAHTVAGPLAAQKYLPTSNPKNTKLLIMVYWGRTVGAEGASSSVAYGRFASASQRLNLAQGATASALHAPHGSGGGTWGDNGNDIGDLSERAAATNAFDDALAVPLAENHRRDIITRQNASMLGYDSSWKETIGHERRRQELVEELEDSRYFVVLMAYDFQLMWKEKKSKLLWETRYSIRAGGNAFDRELLAMTQTASRYFGQDSSGLRHKPLPEGHVRLGELKFSEASPDK